MIWVFTGPSASGKTSLAKAIGLKKIISTTTRKRREGEVDGVDYHFISRSKFKLLYDLCEFVEHTIYDGNLYGLHISDIEDAIESNEDTYCIVDHIGVEYLKRNFNNNVRVIFVYADKEVLRERMIQRGDSLESIEKRLSTYENEMKYKDYADYIICTQEPYSFRINVRILKNIIG